MVQKLRFEWAIVGLALAAMTVLGGCGEGEHERIVPVPTHDEGPVYELYFEPPFRAPDGRQTAAIGRLAAVEKASPGTRWMGTIVSVPVDLGQHVERGQVLARLDTGDLDAMVGQATAAVAMAEAEHTNAQTHDRRMRSLHQRGSVTDRAREDAAARLLTAAAALEAARSGLAAARSRRKDAEILSPLEGIVVEKFVEVGDTTVPGTPAFVVEDPRELEVIAEVATATVGALAIGDKVTAEIAGTEWPAEISQIVGVADPGSRTVTVKARLEPPEDLEASAPRATELRSGAFARLFFARRAAPGEASEGSEELLVRRSAVVRRGQLEALFLLRPGENKSPDRVALRYVETGQTTADGEFVSILAGLEPGDLYAVEPPSGLLDGARTRRASLDTVADGPEAR